MGKSVQLVVFALGEQRHAIALAQVERVVFAAQVTPVPGAPAIVLGVIDLQGEVIAVLDVRQRSSSIAQPIHVNDQFLIVQTRLRKVALVVNETLDVVERDASAVSSVGLAPSDPGRQEGVVRLEDGLALIEDVEEFLSAHESRMLDEAMAVAP